jgi:hypothetical protein
MGRDCPHPAVPPGRSEHCVLLRFQPLGFGGGRNSLLRNARSETMRCLHRNPGNVGLEEHIE